MNAAEQIRYAKAAKRFRNRIEAKAYVIVRGYLRGWLQEITASIRITDQSMWLSVSESRITEGAHMQMLSAVYGAVGPLAAHNEFKLVRSRIVAGMKREHPLFDLGFFSRKWQQVMMSVLSSPETAARITKITDTTRSQVRAALTEAISKRLDVRQASKLLADRIGGAFLRSRALLIARTETTRAANLAAEMGAAETGIELQKVWIATADTRTRPAHLAMRGKDPIAKDALFVVGSKKMKYPGDPAGGPENVINCRCVVSFVPVMRNGMPVMKPASTQLTAGGIASRIGGAVVSIGIAIADLFKHETVNNNGRQKY